MATVKEAPQAAETKAAEQQAKPKAEAEREGEMSVARRSPGMPAAWENRPFAFMRQISEEMDRAFDRFFEEFGHRFASMPSEVQAAPATWAPRVDVLEREGKLIVRADLPGLTKDDVQVEVTDDAITIQGERSQEKEERRAGYLYSERSYGSFYRAIPLPEGADPSQATAEFRNGVLEVAMPAPSRPEKKAKRLDIQEGK